MASLIKLNTPSGTRYAVKWLEGKARRQKNFKTRKEAVAFRAEKEREVATVKADGTWQRVPTFAEATTRFMQEKRHPIRGEPLEDLTLRIYQSYLDEYLIPRVGDKRVSQVSREDFEGVYDIMVQMGFANKTRKEAIRLMSAVLTFAKAKRHIEHVPEHGLDLRKTLAETIAEKIAFEEKTYTPDEVYTMLKAADSLAADENLQTRRVWSRYRPFVYFLAYTGVRMSEARGFPRKDWHGKNGFIRITQAAKEKGKAGMVKTVAGYRKIDLHPALADVIEPWLAVHKGALVFGTSRDLPVSNSNFYSRLLEPLKDRADKMTNAGGDDRFVKVRRGPAFHAFRHHFASILIASGARLKSVQMVLGHATPVTTLNTYTHLFEDEEQSVVAKLEI